MLRSADQRSAVLLRSTALGFLDNIIIVPRSTKRVKQLSCRLVELVMHLGSNEPLKLSV